MTYFQEFVIQETKVKKKKAHENSVLFRGKKAALQLYHLIPLFPHTPLWGRSASISLISEGFSLKHQWLIFLKFQAFV